VSLSTSQQSKFEGHFGLVSQVTKREEAGFCRGLGGMLVFATRVACVVQRRVDHVWEAQQTSLRFGPTLPLLSHLRTPK
jgi:hypothetical protein